MAQQRTIKAKERMLDALRKTYGVIGPAAQLAGINRRTHLTWMNEDKEYADEYWEVMELQKDFVEAKILENIDNNDGATMRFYAATKMQDRGYRPIHGHRPEDDVPEGIREQTIIILPHNDRDDQKFLETGEKE